MTEIATIREWLGVGAINVFGLPMSGKDTQGEKLATALSAQLLSSGALVRATGIGADEAATGKLVSTDMFQGVILPNLLALAEPERPLVLSSVGRWHGEEQPLLAQLEKIGHPLKAVILLDLTEAEVWRRWQVAQENGRLVENGAEAVSARRADDASPEIFERRLTEFQEKTQPVLNFYAERNLLIKVDGVGSREEVFARIVAALFAKCTESIQSQPLDVL